VHRMTDGPTDRHGGAAREQQPDVALLRAADGVSFVRRALSCGRRRSALPSMRTHPATMPWAGYCRGVGELGFVLRYKLQDWSDT